MAIKSDTSDQVRHARTEPDEDTDVVTLHIPSRAHRPYLRMSLKRYFGIKFALL